MSETKRKNFTGEFKAKVALEAIRSIKSVNEIGQVSNELYKSGFECNAHNCECTPRRALHII